MQLEVWGQEDVVQAACRWLLFVAVWLLWVKPGPGGAGRGSQRQGGAVTRLLPESGLGCWQGYFHEKQLVKLFKPSQAKSRSSSGQNLPANPSVLVVRMGSLQSHVYCSRGKGFYYSSCSSRTGSGPAIMGATMWPPASTKRTQASFNSMACTTF